MDSKLFIYATLRNYFHGHSLMILALFLIFVPKLILAKSTGNTTARNPLNITHTVDFRFPNMELVDAPGNLYVTIKVPFYEMGDPAKRLAVSRAVEFAKEDIRLKWKSGELPTTLEQLLDSSKALVEIGRPLWEQKVAESSGLTKILKMQKPSNVTVTNKFESSGYTYDTTKNKEIRVSYQSSTHTFRPSGVIAISGVQANTLYPGRLKFVRGGAGYYGWVNVPYCVYKIRKVPKQNNTAIEANFFSTDSINPLDAAYSHAIHFLFGKPCAESLGLAIQLLKESEQAELAATQSNQALPLASSQANPSVDGYSYVAGKSKKRLAKPAPQKYHYFVEEVRIESARQSFIFLMGNFLTQLRASISNGKAPPGTNQRQKQSIKNDKPPTKDGPEEHHSTKLTDKFMSIKGMVGLIWGDLTSPDQFSGWAFGVHGTKTFTKTSERFGHKYEWSLAGRAGLMVGQENLFPFVIGGFDIGGSLATDTSSFVNYSFSTAPFFEAYLAWARRRALNEQLLIEVNERLENLDDEGIHHMLQNPVLHGAQKMAVPLGEVVYESIPIAPFPIVPMNSADRKQYSHSF